MESEIWKPNYLKSGQNGGHFVKNYFFYIRLPQEFSSFQVVGSIAIAIVTADHLKSDIQKVQILNVSGFQMVGFQIPIVPSMHHADASIKVTIRIQ